MILLIILIYKNDELVALMDIINTITAVILLINLTYFLYCKHMIKFPLFSE
jgi:uncharacterized membrane protein